MSRFAENIFARGCNFQTVMEFIFKGTEHSLVLVVKLNEYRT